MAEINGISNLEHKNYNINSSKKALESNSGFSSYLGETKSMDKIFEQAAQKYNVPENLLKAIGKAESNFKASAVSRVGAQGVMQLMPATAKELGVTDAFNAEQNIMGGAKYISGLLKKYDGDTRLALAAYNAGSGNVKKYGGIPPFTETQNYVKKVMKYAGQDLDSEIAAVKSGSKIASGGTSSGNPNISSLPVAQKPTSVQNNLTYLYANQTDSIASEQEYLDTLFSYEDYMKFLDLFLKEEEEPKAEGENTNYVTKEINYNIPVMNLLIDQKLI